MKSGSMAAYRAASDPEVWCGGTPDDDLPAEDPPEHDPLSCPCCQKASVVRLAALRTLDHCDTCGGVLDTMPCLHCEGDDPMCECGGTGMIDCPECEGRRTRLRAALEER